MRQILVDTHFLFKKTALIVDGKLEALAIETLESEPVEGAIFLGRVVSVNPVMNAAFVDIGTKQVAYLHANDVYCQPGEPVTATLKNGMELLVQLKSETGRFKGPKVTAKIELTGKFMVVLPGSTQSAVSKRITDLDKKEKLKKMAETILKGHGFIIRTEAATADEARVRAEIERLIDIWETIERSYITVKAPKCVYPALSPSERLLLTHLEVPNTELILGDPSETLELQKFIEDHGIHFDVSLAVARQKRNPLLFEQHHLDTQIQGLLMRKVTLGGGGSLIFDQTEAFLAVDVNAGSATTGVKNSFKAHQKINETAILECLRQLELRNVGGMILIDLIDAESEKERVYYESFIRKVLSDQYTGIYYAGISALGILSFTRKRIGSALVERMTEPCKCCGQGRTQSAAVQLERLLREAIKAGPGIQRYQVSVAIFEVLERFQIQLSRFKADFDIQFEWTKETVGSASEVSFKKLL